MFERLSSNQGSELFAPLEQSAVDTKDVGKFTVFPDGVAVALDARWSENQMRRAPSARRDG